MFVGFHRVLFLFIIDHSCIEEACHQRCTYLEALQIKCNYSLSNGALSFTRLTLCLFKPSGEEWLKMIHNMNLYTKHFIITGQLVQGVRMTHMTLL